MCRIITSSKVFNRLRLLALCAVILVLSGCAVTRGVQDKPWLHPTAVRVDVERNSFLLPGGDDVIGTLAVMKLEKGDTLPDIARHFSLGINAISAANPGVDIWVPEAGERIVLPLSFILPDAPRRGIVVNLAAMRLFRFKGDGKSLAVSTYPVGVGTRERPTPTGEMRVERKATLPTWRVPASIAEDHRKKGDPLPATVPPGPKNPLGECALYLNRGSYVIHGTNKPASIGLKATNGCLRLYPEDVKLLYDDTPVNTPVLIVNQPYLLGQRNGVLYLEVHALQEEGGSTERDKVYGRLREIEKKSARPLDWERVREAEAEALGIPVPILEMSPGSDAGHPGAVEVEHPGELYGKPEVPEIRLEGWYVLAANVSDVVDARRLAAMINHQGPPIPARVLSRRNGHHVIAGPFNDIGEAKDAVKRLRIDLELEGIVIEPVRKI